MTNPDPAPPVTRVVITTDASGDWRWSAYAPNGRCVACSGEGYEHRTHAERMAHALFPGARYDVIS